MTVIGDVHDPPATGGGISPIMPSFPGGISPSGATSGNASPVAPDGYGQLIQVCILFFNFNVMFIHIYYFIF